MHQIADNQLSETMDGFTYFYSVWNGMAWSRFWLIGMIAGSFPLRSWSWCCKNGPVYITDIMHYAEMRRISFTSPRGTAAAVSILEQSVEFPTPGVFVSCSSL